MRPRTTAPLMALVLTLLLAWNGTASAASPGIEVTAADPPFASQGTINLNVTIKGKGFKSGASARFLVSASADPGGVRVNSTTFVNPGQLVANIDVDAAATVANYDIEVQNADGRTGKGTELFAVTAQGAPADVPLNVEFRTYASGATGDRITDDSRGPYVDGVDGVSATFPGSENFVIRAAAIAPKDPDRRNFVVVFRQADLVFAYRTCTGQPCFLDGTPVLGQHEARHLTVNRSGSDCAGNPSTTTPRDMAPGECIRGAVHMHMSRVNTVLSCGPWAPSGLDLNGTDPLRVERSSGSEYPCPDWSVTPFQQDGAERLVCRLFESGRGRYDPVKIADFNLPFAFCAVAQ